MTGSVIGRGAGPAVLGASTAATTNSILPRTGQHVLLTVGLAALVAVLASFASAKLAQKAR